MGCPRGGKESGSHGSSMKNSYMKHVEKKCCRLKSGRIPFSPEASLWICRCQVYRSLLWWHNGKLRNYGNLCCTARRCQINAPFQLTVDDIKLHMVICKEKLITFKSTGNATGGSTWWIVSKWCTTKRTKLQNKISLLSLNKKRTTLSGAGSTMPSQDAKVDLKALIVAVMPIYCLSETINLFFSCFYVFLTT